MNIVTIFTCYFTSLGNIVIHSMGLKVLVQLVPAGTLQTEADINTLTPCMYILHYGNKSVRVAKQ